MHAHQSSNRSRQNDLLQQTTSQDKRSRCQEHQTHTATPLAASDLCLGPDSRIFSTERSLLQAGKSVPRSKQIPASQPAQPLRKTTSQDKRSRRQEHRTHTATPLAASDVCLGPDSRIFSTERSLLHAGKSVPRSKQIPASQPAQPLRKTTSHDKRSRRQEHQTHTATPLAASDVCLGPDSRIFSTERSLLQAGKSVPRSKQIPASQPAQLLRKTTSHDKRSRHQEHQTHTATPLAASDPCLGPDSGIFSTKRSRLPAANLCLVPRRFPPASLRLRENNTQQLT